MTKENNIIENDVVMTKRFAADNQYAEKITDVYCAIRTLEISNMHTFYQYKDCVNNFRDVTYLEATYLKRMSNDSYAKKVEELAGISVPKEKSKELIDISELIRGK